MKIEVVHEDDGSQAGSSGRDSPGTAAKQKLASVMENLKGALKKTKQCDDTQERKRKATIKVQIGWHNYKSQTKSYSQVKSNRGGGVINLWVQRTITYQEVQQKSLDTFFPSGKSSHLGRIDEYDYFIGNNRCEPYDTSSFSVENVFQEGGSRARIYLFTKLKTKTSSVVECDSSHSTSSDDDTELIDPFASSKPSTSASFSSVGDNTSSSNKPPSPKSGTPSVIFKPSSLLSNNQCGICADRVRDSFFIPCGHSFCAPCAVFLEDSSDGCPYCKCTVEKVGKLFD